MQFVNCYHVDVSNVIIKGLSWGENVKEISTKQHKNKLKRCLDVCLHIIILTIEKREAKDVFTKYCALFP